VVWNEGVAKNGDQGKTAEKASPILVIGQERIPQEARKPLSERIPLSPHK
jgi:hypothetical protein